MKKFTIWLTCLLFFASMGLAHSQTKTITGTVTGADDGLPIPGVTVMVPGTSTGTTTDLNGIYTLKVGLNVNALRFSYVGMETQDIEIGTQTIINVVMRTSATALDEVIVVAFGTAKKSSFTGSAAVIKNEEIVNTSGSLVKAIQGTVAGVTVIGEEIRIRGTASFNASGTPLYVVDGVVGAPRPRDEDIENMTILKDAASTALYGSRAANGVIIITLKKGKKGVKPTFTVKYQKTFFKRIEEKYDFMNSEQHFRTVWEGMRNSQLRNNQTLSDAIMFANENIVGEYNGHNPYNMDQPFDANGDLKSNAKLLYSTDWENEILRNAVRDEVYLASEGGSENINYHFSINWDKFKGQVSNSQSEKIGVDLSINAKANSFIDLGARARIEYVNDNNTYQASSVESNLYNMAKVLNPVSPLYVLTKVNNSDGTWTYDYELDALGEKQFEYRNSQYNGYNPLGLINLDYDKSYRYNSFFSPFIRVKALEGLEFYAYGSARLNTLRSDYWQTNLYGSGATIGGFSEKSSWHQKRLTGHAQLTYQFNVKEDHHFDLLIATSRDHTYYSEFDASIIGFELGETSHEFGAGTKPQKPSSDIVEDAKIAYFSNFKYDYKNKYYLSASIRHDGSAKFGANNKWGTFWSVGASWKMSDEDFLKNADWVDLLKFRASYGVTGTDAIDSYMFGNYFTLGANYDHKIGLVHSNLPNDNLGWETNYQFSAAFEFELFGKLSGILEFYNKDSKDLLLEVPIPLTTGFQTVFKNIGEMNNRGIELTLNHVNIRKQDFTWKSLFTLSYNKNKITKLPDGNPIQQGSKRWEEGKSRYEFYIREWAGVNPDNGAGQWYIDVLDNDGNVTGRELTEDYQAATKYYVGRSLPDVFGSLKNDFSYKGFDLSINLYYSIGGKVYDGSYAAAMHDGADGVAQLSTDALNAWKEPGQQTDVPIYIHNNTEQSNYMSTRWLVDGTFLKIKNISLSYNLPESICNKLKMSEFKLFATVDNLHTFTKYKSGDPEQRLSGRSFGYLLPNQKTFRFGIQAKF